MTDDRWAPPIICPLTSVICHLNTTRRRRSNSTASSHSGPGSVGGLGEDRIRDSGVAGTGTRPAPRVRTTGGGDGCRRGAPLSARGGVARAPPADFSLEHDLFRKPVPTFRHHAPLFPYPRPTGSAMKRVWSPDLTRISTARLPSPRASASALRTSAGLDTGFPAPPRRTPPDWKPWLAAGPSGPTEVTTTPSLPAPATPPEGAKVSPRRGSSGPAACSRASGGARGHRGDRKRKRL